MNDNSEVGFIMIGGTEHMDEKRNWQSKIAGIFLILLGYFLGGNAPKTGYCYGDRVFEFLGLPAWSEGMTGTHLSGNHWYFHNNRWNRTDYSTEKEYAHCYVDCGDSASAFDKSSLACSLS